MVRALCFHCRGPQFDPWLGNWDSTKCMAKRIIIPYDMACWLPGLHLFSSSEHRTVILLWESWKTTFISLLASQVAQIRIHHCRGHGLSPWPENIPYTEEQLNLCTTATEARVPRAHAQNKRRCCKEKPCTATEGSPWSQKPEKACLQQRRPSTARNKQIKQCVHVKKSK